MKAFLILLQAGLFSALCAGTAVGHDDEQAGLGFRRLAREVFVALDRNRDAAVLTDGEMARFDAAIRNIRIDEVRGPILDSSGTAVNARVIDDVRYQERVIEIDRTVWKPFMSQRVVAHRRSFQLYLSAIDINDDNGVISKRIEGQPFAAFLQLRAPALVGTKLFEQLQQYFGMAIVPEWQKIDGGTYRGLCFEEGDDRGVGVGFVFLLRDNGKILDPSKLLKYSHGHDAYEIDVLFEEEGSLRDQHAGHKIRMYHDTLVVSFLETYCYLSRRG